VQTYAMNSFIGLMLTGGASEAIVEFAVSYGILIICMMTGTALLSSMVYAMMTAYNQRENGLQGLVFADFKEPLVTNFWRILKVALFMFLIYLVVIGLAVLIATTVSPWSLLLTIPIILVAMCALVVIAMIIPVYLFEEIDLIPALRKAWKLGLATLGGMIGLIIVISIISSVFQTVTMMPWYILTVIGGIMTTVQESSMANSVGYKFALFILGLVQSYGMYVSSIMGVVGLAFQYFHAREKVEGVTIESNIENFKEL